MKIRSNDEINRMINDGTLPEKSDVLALDNTTAFTPDADYEPATKKYVDDNDLGVGQTWQDVTSSREKGVTYTNTTGRPIYVSAIVAGGGGVACTLTIDGVAISTGASEPDTQAGIVPDNSTYDISGSGTIDTWAELR